MEQSKWLHILVAVITALLLGVGLQGGNSLPAIAGPAPDPANAPLLLGSGGVFCIAGTSFVPTHSSTDYDYKLWGGVSIAAGYEYMAASVELPTGATITSLTFYWDDRDADDDMHLRLRRYTRTSATSQQIAEVSSSGSGGVDSSSTTTISTPLVDNINYAYVLYIEWDAAAGSNLTAFGAKINYSTAATTATADLPLPPEDAPPSLEEYPASPDGQATVTVAESSSERVQIPEEGPVLHTGGEIVEMASSPSDVGPLWGETDWQYYSIAGSNFHPAYAGTTHTIVPGGGRYVTGGQPFLIAPLDLPHGSTIQQVKVTFYDNATQNATWTLYQVDRQGDGSYLWRATPDRQSTAIAPYYSPTLQETVDNQNYAYYFMATLNTAAGSNLRVYEVAIGYTAAANVYLPIILKSY